MQKTHYVARIVVTRVTKTMMTPNNTRDTRTVEASRDVAEIASITVSASDVSSLETKVAGHMALVEDGETQA